MDRLTREGSSAIFADNDEVRGLQKVDVTLVQQKSLGVLKVVVGLDGLGSD